jgi:hypothetical protein
MSGEERGWISHYGSGRPNPPLTYVEVKFRYGATERGTSGFIDWVWGDVEDELDVVEWRKVPEPPSKDEVIAALVKALETVYHDWDGEPEDMIHVQEALALARAASS